MNSILSSSLQKLAIVGLAKNVGKTTTLNWVIEEGHSLAYKLGLLSIGVDGEGQDVWDFHQKPAIKIKEGMWAASAKAALQESTARFRIIEELKPSSPLGPVYVLECIGAGKIKLAGTHMIKDIQNAIARFTEHGVTLSVIDGAYDRLSSAQEQVAPGFILCTGAALDPNLESAVKKTEEYLLRWQLPKWEQEDHISSEGIRTSQTMNNRSQKVAYQQNGKWIVLEGASLLTLLDPLRLIVAEGIDFLSIPGALTEWIMQHFISCRKPFAWIIDDPSKMFLTQESLMRWLRAGGEIYVRRKSQLLALSVSPFSTHGEQDSDRWLHRMKEIAGNIPVIDAMRRKIV